MAGAKPYTLRNIGQHPLARMVPLFREQAQSYRLGEKIPHTGGLDGHGPMWEAITLTLGPRQTLQARINLQRDYTLISIAVSATSNVSGGFRAQLYDMVKKRRLADRGVQQALLGGQFTAAPGGAFALRDPYRFDTPDSQLFVIAQNLEIVTNTVQLALYGQVLRFNQPVGHENFPGGPFSALGWGGQRP